MVWDEELKDVHLPHYPHKTDFALDPILEMELRQALQDITPGDWQCSRARAALLGWHPETQLWRTMAVFHTDHFNGEANAHFVQLAWEGVPALLHEVDKLRAALNELDCQNLERNGVRCVKPTGGVPALARHEWCVVCKNLEPEPLR